MLQCAGQINIRFSGIFGATEVWIPLEEHREFEWTIFEARPAQIRAEDAACKAVDDTVRQANSGHNVQDGQDDGQNMNKDPDSVQPVLQDFRYSWKFVTSHLTNAKCDAILYPVNDNRDREWAKRLEWAIEKHRGIASDAV